MLRLALINGCQHKAARYAQAAARLRGLKFTALAQPDEVKRRAAAEAFGGATAAESLSQLLSDHAGEFDAVAIHGSVAKRAAWACQAAAAGKHVFVSTPLAADSQEADRIAAACQDAGVTLCVGSHVRSRPSVAAVKSALDGGKLGAPGLLRVHCWEPKDDGDFRSQILQQLDLALWMFPQPPAEVYAVGHNLPANEDSWPDYLQIHLGFPQGGMALISIARSLPAGDEYQTVSLIASTGAAYADDHLQKHLVFRGQHPRAVQQDEMVPSIVAQLREFQTAIAEKRDPSVAAKAMKAAMTLTDAVWTSLTERQPVRLPEEKILMPASGPEKTFRVAVLSVIKHSYVARGVASHPRFELVVVADDPTVPDWVHERNQKFADEFKIPYVRDVERAIQEYHVDVVAVSTEAERHCDLSVRAANLGVHVIQDKPMSTKLSECDRLVDAIERNGVKFLMWNRNRLPAVMQATEIIRSGEIGKPYAVHCDFYFAKDAGPPKGSRKPGDPPINWLELQRAAHVDGSDGGVGKQPMGELQIEGIYPLAYLQQITGAKFERVFARTTAMFHQGNADNDVDDLASVSLEMSDGIVGTLAIGRIGKASHPDIGEIKISVLGTEGALVIAEARPEVGVYYRGQPDKEFRHRRVAIENDFLLADNFARAIDIGGDTVLNVRVSRHITAAVEAAIRSGKTGQVERVA